MSFKRQLTTPTPPLPITPTQKSQCGFDSLHSLANAPKSPSSKLFTLSLEYEELKARLNQLGGITLLELHDIVNEKDVELASLTNATSRMSSEITTLRKQITTLSTQVESNSTSTNNKKLSSLNENLCNLNARSKSTLEVSLHEIQRLQKSLDEANVQICTQKKAHKSELSSLQQKLAQSTAQFTCENNYNLAECENTFKKKLAKVNQRLEATLEELHTIKATNDVLDDKKFDELQFQFQRVSAKYNKAKSIIAMKEAENVELKKNQQEYVERQLKKAKRLRALVNIKNLKHTV